ncbi:hypothetical protein B4O97_16560 [Marispirochaeta aestuarii]|uniref:Uncharacterized protein n=1 Tax=Marispirochaeta aestuarii TaxID=1963862 RepID=A0A1Y1RU96_9SPIO|nr:hypothetical protein [Marispirochaeta aestuarii]ORC31874.1 hypothetical protein B4O97_16560 [Marispirochaeta aestuarii]
MDQENRNKNASQKSGGRSRSSQRGKRRGGRGGSNKRYYSECPICGKGVRDLLTAVAWGDERKPSHFDCVLKAIADQEDVQGKEKVVYLGAGSFGIVKFRSGTGSSPRFTVRKRVQLEEKEEKLDWRKKVSRDIR